MAFKQCSDCLRTKEYADFYKKRRWAQYPDSEAGYSSKCRICTNKDRARYRSHNLQKCKDADTNSRFKRSYGITLSQYKKMHKAQSGLCIGCLKNEAELTSKLHVDHCHVSGQVRGLLCRTCNLILGYVNDNPDILKNLITYLGASTASKPINVDTKEVRVNL